MPTTEAVWITRERTTVRHLRGVLEMLEGAEALQYTEVRIIAVGPGAGIEIPPGFSVRSSVTTGRVVSEEQLPAEGILMLSEDE